MIINLKKYSAQDIIKSIAQKLGTTSKTDCIEEILEIPKQFGKGRIVGLGFSNGLSLLIFNCFLKEDWTINFEKNKASPLQFNFNIKGNVKHLFNQNTLQYQLNPLQGTITANPATSSQSLQLPHNTEILYNALLINRVKYAKKIECMLEQIPEDLAGVFMDIKATKVFYYHSNYSISIANCIKKITADVNNGLVRCIFLEAKGLELFSKQIKQYEDDLHSPGRQVMLRRYDLDKIQLARDLLIKDLVEAPTIEELARKVGINRQKLKQGFKKVFDRTINNYLRDERMEAAAMMLLHGLSVRQTSTQVGYTNQSHFSKRFKERYGLLPKDYVKNVKLNIIPSDLDKEERA